MSDFRQGLEELEKKEKDDKIARKMEKLIEKQNRKKDKKGKTDATSSTVAPIKPKAPSIEVGSAVKIKGQTTIGQVLELNGKNAIVAFGRSEERRVGKEC